MEENTKKVARLFGFAFLVISIYFSYDGFDQRVTGGNGSYTGVAKLIGIVLAVGFSVLQFILNSRPDQLNLTLKVAGLATYVYSIWTNYLGIVHTLEMPVEMAWVIAVSLDVLPEPMISWGFGEAAKGDLLGNIWGWVWNIEPKKQGNQQGQQGKQHQQHQQHQGKPKHQQGQQHQQNQQSRPAFAVDFRRDYVDDEDDDEESDTQPQFRPQRQASFGGSGGSKKSNGDGHHYVRPEFKGKMGKR